jgi:PilZ domain
VKALRRVPKGRDKTLEPRNAIRYPIAASVVFRWEDQMGTVFRGMGVTRDISVSGAFIIAMDCPPAGSMLTVEIFLPYLENRRQFMRMVTEGRVARVERAVPGESQYGFVVITDGFAIPDLANKN